MANSYCRSCGEPVIWVRTIHGRKHPLNAEPARAGEWVIQDSVAGPTMLQYMPMHDNTPRYTSHFATCEFAGEHRRKRKGQR